MSDDAEELVARARQLTDARIKLTAETRRLVLESESLQAMAEAADAVRLTKLADEQGAGSGSLVS